MTIKPNDAIDGEDEAEGESKDKPSGAVRTGRLRGALSDLFISIELIGMGLLAMLAISLVLSAMWWLTHESGASVQKETAAGQVLRVELRGGLFTRALVETDAGFYALQEGASLRKGELVTLRERQDGSRSLCDLEGRCTGLLGVLR